MQLASTSLKRLVGSVRQRTIKVIVKINSAVLLLSKLCNFRLPGVANNACDSTRMLNVDEDVTHVNYKLKILQRQSVLQIQNVRMIPVFLLSDAKIAFLSQNASPTFFNDARSASKARPAI